MESLASFIAAITKSLTSKVDTRLRSADLPCWDFGAIVCSLVLLTHFFTVSSAFSQQRTTGQRQADTITISHISPRAAELPPPGYEIELIITLKNTKSTNLKLHALTVRDGELLDTTLSDAQYNNREEPFYRLPVVAPLGELVYQFLLVNSDGSLSVSERYAVSRGCLPLVTPAPQGIDPELRGEQRLASLDILSNALDRDITRYQVALGYLQQLKQMLNNRDSGESR